MQHRVYGAENRTRAHTYAEVQSVGDAEHRWLEQNLHRVVHITMRQHPTPQTHVAGQEAEQSELNL